MSLKKPGRRQFIRPKSLLSVLGAGLPLPSAAAETHLLRLGRSAMACQFEILMRASERGRIDQVLRSLDLIHALERQMTVYRDDSELAEINRRAAQEPVQVEKRLFELLELGVRLSRETQQAFDFTAGPLTRIWGFHQRSGRVPEADEVKKTLETIGTGHLRLDPSRHTVSFRRPGVELNLGAIGKGYALDRTAESLGVGGFADFLLHAGFSGLLARGSSPAEAGNGWPIGIRHPFRDENLACVRLRNRAMATSGIREQHFVEGGRRLGHIIDPRTGYPAHGCLSATAVAASAAEADALSTAFFILPRREVEQFCRQHSSVGALIVPEQDSPDEELTVLSFGIPPEDLEVYS